MSQTQQTAEIEQKAFLVLNELFGSAKAGAVIQESRSADPDGQLLILNNLLSDVAQKSPDASRIVFERTRDFAGKLTDPVPIDVFLEDSYYLGLKGEIYPLVMEHAVEMNSGDYVEAVLTGGIGTAKTTLALWTTAYQLYQLSLLLAPQNYFGLEHSSELLFIFQSINEKLAKAVDYDRFVTLLDRSPYFKGKFPYNNQIKSELQFRNRIIVKPVSGKDTAAIGQNVFGGIIDEVNYMAKVEKSKQSVDGGGYDQAISLYNSIARRRKSRFMKMGKVPGIFCLVSSTRYPGEFTDLKIAEAQDDPTIYVYNKRHWDIKPDAYGKERFRVFRGDDSRQPRILDDGEAVHPKDRENILLIPEEHRVEFQRDIINALREIAGVSTLARCPFFMNTEALAAAFGKVDSVLSRTSVDFDREQVAFHVKRFRNPTARRCVHVDLALTGDSVGIACGYVPGFTAVPRGGTVIETLPKIELDFSLRVTPPPNDEIKFDKIRTLIVKLRDAGLNIQWVTFDSFQSRYLMQLLRQQGFYVGLVSCDKDSAPYEFLKGAIYDGRLSAPTHDFLRLELARLEKDPKDGKVDHPPNGSKDVADAVAGVAYGLTMKRIIWAEHNISPVQIPATIQEASQKKAALNDPQDRPRPFQVAVGS